MPVLATQHTAAGAKAFAGFFIKTIDWGYATTSSAYMRHYFAGSCTACLSFASAFDKVRMAKRHYVGGRITVATVLTAPKPLSRLAETTGLVSFSATSQEEVTAANRYVVGYPAVHDQRFEVSLTWRADFWSVSYVALEV